MCRLSENLRQQQESFSADRKSYEAQACLFAKSYMWSQIRGLENRVNILQHENKELESHLLQQSIDLQRYFVLKCTSQGREAELINQGRCITVSMTGV